MAANLCWDVFIRLFKSDLIKKLVKEKTFIEFNKIQDFHEKGTLMHHDNLNLPQDYLVTNKLTNKEISVLFNLRCHSIRGIRDNFQRQYHGDVKCPLCQSSVDNQKHALQCSVLKKHIYIDPAIRYEAIYGTLEEQIPVAKLFYSLLEVRERILEERASLPERDKILNKKPTGAL